MGMHWPEAALIPLVLAAVGLSLVVFLKVVMRGQPLERAIERGMGMDVCFEATPCPPPPVPDEYEKPLCPSCSSNRWVVPMWYGCFPSKDVMHDAWRGRIVLGGDGLCVNAWCCKGCGWRKRLRAL